MVSGRTLPGAAGRVAWDTRRHGIAFACHEIVAPKAVAPDTVARVNAATPLDALSLAELELLAQMEDSLIGAIQQDASDVGAMAELAHLYMLHGAYDVAVGPLARALELAPDREDLRSELRLALQLGTLGPVTAGRAPGTSASGRRASAGR